MKLTIKDLSQIAIVAALYFVLTITIAPLSYGPIQFRFSEVLVLLCFYRKKYGIGLIIGCALANLFSPYPLDFIFGTLATVVAVIGICFLSKNLAVATIFPTLSCLIVAGEISLVAQLPFFMTAFEVLLGEAIVINFIGYPLFKQLERNKSFDFILLGERDYKKSKHYTIDNVSIAFFAIFTILFVSLPLFNDNTNLNQTLSLFAMMKIQHNWVLLAVLILPLVNAIILNINSHKLIMMLALVLNIAAIIALSLSLQYPSYSVNILMVVIYYLLFALHSGYIIFSFIKKKATN